jgi:hypothetical protein
MATRHLPQRIQVRSSDTGRRRGEEGRSAHAALDIAILECVASSERSMWQRGEERDMNEGASVGVGALAAGQQEGLCKSACGRFYAKNEDLEFSLLHVKISSTLGS